MPLIKDIKMRIENDWSEYVIIRGSDTVMCQDNYAIWQAVEGELKTKRGTCSGIGLQYYGSRLYTLIGSNLNDSTPQEVQGMIWEVTGTYSEILNCEIQFNQDFWDKGNIVANLRLSTIFGNTIHEFIYNIQNGCG